MGLDGRVGGRVAWWPFIDGKTMESAFFEGLNGLRLFTRILVRFWEEGRPRECKEAAVGFEQGKGRVRKRPLESSNPKPKSSMVELPRAPKSSMVERNSWRRGGPSRAWSSNPRPKSSMVEQISVLASKSRNGPKPRDRSRFSSDF